MKVKDQFDAMNIPIVAIGSGTPKQAREFAENFDFKAELYVDPSLESFKAFDLERGFFKTLGLSSLRRGISTMMNGFHQGLSAGDLWQQGGTFVIGPGNRMIFAHRNNGAGDQPDMEAVLKICETNALELKY